MGYQIAVNNDITDAAVHDSARDALTEYQSLRESHGDAVTVLRDNVRLDPTQLIADADIEAVIEDEKMLPPTYQHGRNRQSDVALGTDGYRHGVKKPPNPEDNWE